LFAPDRKIPPFAIHLDTYLDICYTLFNTLEGHILEAAAFQWDDWNVEHIARHRVTPQEAEEVIDDDPLILKSEDGKYLAYGQSYAGRYLLVVFVWKPGQIIRVISARDMTRAEKKRYRKRRK
jgi:uncharacterized DUF497 family protein